MSLIGGCFVVCCVSVRYVMNMYSMNVYVMFRLCVVLFGCVFCCIVCVM